MKQPKFVVVDGLTGSGKSTIYVLLSNGQLCAATKSLILKNGQKHILIHQLLLKLAISMFTSRLNQPKPGLAAPSATSYRVQTSRTAVWSWLTPSHSIA